MRRNHRLFHRDNTPLKRIEPRFHGADRDRDKGFFE